MVLQPSFLHTDFNKWRDEDDSEEEDTGMDDDFEAVSYNSTKSNIHLLCLFSNRSQMTSKCGKKKNRDSRHTAQCVTF